MVIIGIDPGVGGGLACLTPDCRVTAVDKMPDTDPDVLQWFAWVTASGAIPSVAYLEQVSSSPQMGVVSAFTFGRGYGALCMALAALKIRREDVRPQRWQKALGCLTKGDKNVTKRKAQALFPNVKVTHHLADALLIAEYGRRLQCGILPGKR